MKVLIVAKTRRGNGACVGGITEHGKSVRLVAADAATNEHAGLEYAVGEVWEIAWSPDPAIQPPHVENIVVQNARRLRNSTKLEATIHRFMPPVSGGPDKLFEGLARHTTAGGLYIAHNGKLPAHSTMFWIPDESLQLDCEGKRIRYRYPTEDGGRTITFVGFQEPLREIPAGTLLRITLAHPWRPKEQPDEELRCFVQLSGWYLGQDASVGAPSSLECHGHSETEPPPPAPAAAGASIEQAAKTLKETFGFSEFLPVQQAVVTRLLNRRDTLVVMPTGSGKSLCYQLPALLFNGLTVVVSPLVALMQDQVRQLRQLDIPAACLNHMVALPEWTRITSQIRHGYIRILYVAPETLLRPELLLLLEQSALACLAIDEAHCISEWGHDFRPEYRQLSSVRRRFAAAVCAALTATATARVRQDIRALLNIPDEGEFVASFNRPNLRLNVARRKDVLAQVLDYLKDRRGQSGIIYCGTRKQTDELCAGLNANGWPALPYHAGLADNERRQNQERFLDDDAPLMVATVAFGMGINKPNVRFVVHAHMPKDLESYYQEIGRAGRDRLPSDCLLLYTRGDEVLHRRFIEEGAASQAPGRQARLKAMLRFAETRECRRIPLLAYFGETVTAACGNCDNCTSRPDERPTVNVTAEAKQFLSCVVQTGESFGVLHIIGVLRGSQAAKVLARRHDRLSCFGAGTGHSTERWRELAHQFLHLGIVEQDLDHGSLRVAAKGRLVMQGAEPVLVPVEQPPASATTATTAPDRQDPDLFERLRQLRRQLASEIGMPPYIIFPDRALHEMAARKPQDESQFLDINGVGQAKLANYGQLFLDRIRAYCQEKGLPAMPPDSRATPAPIIRPQSHRTEAIARQFLGGKPVDQIALEYGVLPETVLYHLEDFSRGGGRLPAQWILALSTLSEAERNKVIQLFKRLGLERLALVHEALAGAVPYDALRVIRLYLLADP